MTTETQARDYRLGYQVGFMAGQGAILDNADRQGSPTYLEGFKHGEKDALGHYAKTKVTRGALS